MPTHPHLFGVFTALSFFGIGVILLEGMGLFGDHDHSLDSDGGETGLSQHDFSDSHSDSSSGEDGSPLNSGQWTRYRQVARVAFRSLYFFRLTTYFFAGFGPAGLICLTLGLTRTVTLVFASVAGLAIMLAARSILAFMRKDLDSTVTDDDLVGRAGEVIVQIPSNGTGRIRLQFGMTSRDRYAIGESSESFPKGSLVKVIGLSGSDLVVASPSRPVPAHRS